jgi:hypothetical protein
VSERSHEGRTGTRDLIVTENITLDGVIDWFNLDDPTVDQATSWRRSGSRVRRPTPSSSGG